MFQQLSAQVPAAGGQLQVLLKNVNALMDKYLLDPAELFQVKFLTSQFRLLCAHVAALQSELLWVKQGRVFSNAGFPPFLGSVFIRDQPAFSVALKGKPFEDPYVVEVVSGVLVDVKAAGSATATLLCKEIEFDGQTLDHATIEMDAARRVGVFSQLRPLMSARMNATYVQFFVELSIGGGPVARFKSDFSEPSLIITHDSQWLEAESKMLKLEVFRDAKVAPWQRIANALHLRYMRMTKQELKDPARKLTLSDLHYFYHRFFMATTVNVSKFDKFLQWFMPVLQQLRFKRHIKPMWLQGLIFGFIDKEKCNRTLAAFEEGTFLLRFSESSPGLFAVAYVSDDKHEPVKHYLVKPEDISSLSLADFIRAKPQWVQLLQLDPNTSALTKQHKNKALHPYLTPDQKQTGGYVLL